MGMMGRGSGMGGMGGGMRAGGMPGGGKGIIVGRATSSTIRGSLPWSKGQRSPRTQNPFSGGKKIYIYKFKRLVLQVRKLNYSFIN